MSRKVYTEQILATLIDVAKHYVDEPDLRNGIIAKCYQEIGKLVIGEPAKEAIDMNAQQSAALKDALRRRQKEQRGSTTGTLSKTVTP